MEPIVIAGIEVSIADLVCLGLAVLFFITTIIGILVSGSRKGKIYELENNIDDLEEALSNLRKKVKAKVDEANQKLRDKNSKIKLLESQLEEAGNNVLVEDNSEEVAKLKNEIENIKISKDNEIKKISKEYEQKIIDVRAECGEKMADSTELQKERDELVIRNAELETLVEELKQEATSAKQEAVEAKAAKPKAAPKPKQPKKPLGTEVDYSRYTKTELLAMCQSVGIATSPKMSKGDMIILLGDYNKAKKVEVK